VVVPSRAGLRCFLTNADNRFSASHTFSSPSNNSGNAHCFKSRKSSARNMPRILATPPPPGKQFRAAVHSGRSLLPSKRGEGQDEGFGGMNRVQLDWHLLQNPCKSHHHERAIVGRVPINPVG